jgi:hypothetical protein
MSFIATISILSALKTAIAAINLPASYSAIAGYPKAFTAVEIYAQEDLLKAFEDLYLQDDRACFIIPGGDAHENVRDGRVVSSDRDTEIHLLFSDRDYNREQAELVGGAEAPGVIVLKDLLINSLYGKNLGVAGVFLIPTTGDPLILRKQEQEDAPGRAAWAQSFTTTAGSMKASIPR